MVDAVNQRGTILVVQKKKMTKAEAKAYRTRWQRVNQFHVQEIRQMTVKQRWEQLNIVFGFALEMGWVKPSSEKEMAPIRARWARLKAGYP
jgi:hypothetical protein